MLQTWLYRKTIENLEPELRFYSMGKKPTRQQGYNTLSWTRVKQFGLSAAASVLTEGITSPETALNMETISLVPKQFGLYCTVSDLLLDVAPIPILSEAATEIGKNGARIIDEYIQTNLSTNGTNVIFANNSAGPRSALTSSDTYKAADLAKANAFLATKGAKRFGSYFVGVTHPNVIFDLQQQSGTGTFIDLNKYTDANVNKAFTGELGALFGVRIVESGFIQPFASTVQVRPMYIMGQNAYAVADLQTLEVYRTPRAPSDSDPLAQRVKTGVKFAFESIILLQNNMVRIEGASTLSYTWTAI